MISCEVKRVLEKQTAEMVTEGIRWKLTGMDGSLVRLWELFLGKFLKIEEQFILIDWFICPPAWVQVTGQMGSVASCRPGEDRYVPSALFFLKCWLLASCHF